MDDREYYFFSENQQIESPVNITEKDSREVEEALYREMREGSSLGLLLLSLKCDLWMTPYLDNISKPQERQYLCLENINPT